MFNQSVSLYLYENAKDTILNFAYRAFIEETSDGPTFVLYGQRDTLAGYKLEFGENRYPRKAMKIASVRPANLPAVRKVVKPCWKSSAMVSGLVRMEIPMTYDQQLDYEAEGEVEGAFTVRASQIMEALAEWDKLFMADAVEEAVQYAENDIWARGEGIR